MSGAAEGRGGSRRKRRRLSRSGDFDRVYRDGRSHANRFLVVYSFPRSGGEEPRLGISVGRKVGGAVVRNQVKRMLRDAFWAAGESLPDGHDFVIVARPEMAAVASERGAAGVEEELRGVLASAGISGEKA
ncbi:MAG TPA: ribonuclease P protein component [Thermoleophilaceae bacterium]|nr:ribonuclease P protein component [Thermoleophilaceae bacterium]